MLTGRGCHLDGVWMREILLCIEVVNVGLVSPSCCTMLFLHSVFRGTLHVVTTCQSISNIAESDCSPERQPSNGPSLDWDACITYKLTSGMR
jgi:hypothetical protein